MLTQSSENKAAAAEFMRYLLSEEAQLAMAEVGQMPVLSGLGDQLTGINDYFGTLSQSSCRRRARVR